LDAAHGLFGEQEYFSTKVDDIAIRARVSSATIYAGSGGKQGLLNTLMDIWSSTAIVSSTLDRVEELDANLRTVAATCRNMREEVRRVLWPRGRRDIVGRSWRSPDDWRICTPCVTAWTSSRRLTSCGFISAIPASSLCATRTAGATNARNDGSAHKRIGLYFEITRFVEGLGKSANARTVFGATCSPVRHICATSIDLENPRP
jgi:AcrR family transcriptional regulator